MNLVQKLKTTLIFVFTISYVFVQAQTTGTPPSEGCYVANHYNNEYCDNGFAYGYTNPCSVAAGIDCIFTTPIDIGFPIYTAQGNVYVSMSQQWGDFYTCYGPQISTDADNDGFCECDAKDDIIAGFTNSYGYYWWSESCESFGCTDPNACNYQSLATENDGSCISANTSLCESCEGSGGNGYIIVNDNEIGGIEGTEDNETCDWDEKGGCTNPTACNWGNGFTYDDNTCIYEDEAECLMCRSSLCSELYVGGGSWPSEVSWEISNNDGSGTLYSGGAPYSDEVCFDNVGSYTLFIDDSYGDGWNGNILTLGGVEYNLLTGSAANFQFSTPFKFLETDDNPTKIESIIAVFSNESGITISWPSQTENTKVETYSIYRNGSPLLVESNNNTSNPDIIFGQGLQSFTDSGPFENCTTYEYTIRTGLCNYAVNSDPLSILINEDISNTWVSESTAENVQKQLFATKGDYTNRTELSWENNNNAFISSFEIERRILNDNPNEANTFIKIAETSSKVHHFVDYNAEGNLLYEYRISALIPTCNVVDNEEDSYSKDMSWYSVGFRTPFSAVHGQITYDGFGAVENAEVFASSSNPLLNKSLIIDEFNHEIIIGDLNNSYSFMGWFKPDFSTSDDPLTILSVPGDVTKKISIQSDYTIRAGENYFSDSTLSEGWNQISVTYMHDTNFLVIYLNGEIILNEITNFSAPSSIQVAQSFKGLLDEFSIWSIPLQESFIKHNFNKYIKRKHTGILAYFHCDEGVANYIYDASIKDTDVFNYSHKLLSSLYNNFSTETPSSDQLKYSANTDINGYYSIEEVRFPSSGGNYQVTPTLAAKYQQGLSGELILLEPAHEFSPTYLSAFLGDGVEDLSNYNFSDISSFDLSGFVYYLNPGETDDVNCVDEDGGDFALSNSSFLKNCNVGLNIPNVNDVAISNMGVEGAFILVDKEPVYDQDGNQVTTNSEGEFSLKVPIGMHEISIEMAGHTFVSSIWNTSDHLSVTVNENTPESEVRRVYNFIETKQGLTFYDNTKKRLVGRVCGGTTQANIPYNGGSINNIGQATFTLKNEGTELHSVVIITDESTGEYSVDLLPISYLVKYDATDGRLFNVPSANVDNVNAVENFFHDDMGNGQGYPFGLIDLDQNNNYHYYPQAFYDNIVTIIEINNYGKTLIPNPDTTNINEGDYSDSITRLSVSVLEEYYALINNPNSIEIRENATADDPDDYYLYTHLFGVNQPKTHEAINQWYSSSIKYDWAENFVYRTKPTISIYSNKYDHDSESSTDSLLILGESIWIIENTTWDDSAEEWVDAPNVELPLINADFSGDSIYLMEIPVFKKDITYQIKASVQEIYKRYDGPVTTDYIDPVSVGTLSLNDGSNSNEYPMSQSETLIPFVPKEVNISLDGESSFEKNFTLTYTNGAASENLDQYYYVLGSRVDEGLNFFSSGPEVVEMVLRDPPGDESYSYIESGSSSIKSVEVFSAGDVNTNHIEKDINLGTTLSIAIPFGGPILTTEIIANTQIDLTFESIIDTTETNTFENSTGLTYRTSSEEFNIGSGGDLYIANNYNIVYGTNKSLRFLKLDECYNQGVVCLGETSDSASVIDYAEGAEELFNIAGVDYALGTTVGLEIVPVGFKTKTVYDQNHIVKTLIPTLEWIRNTYFGIEEVYEFGTDSCYNNEAHELYHKDNNPNPCYTYNAAADTSATYELPFNVFEDINIADYIPSGFVGLVEEALLTSGGSFTEGTQDAMTAVVEAAETGTSVLNAIGAIADSPFWSDFNDIIGAQNLLVGMQIFKSEVIDSYAENLSDFTGGLANLISVLDNINHTLPADKVLFYNQQISLWEGAVEANEKDKASIFDDSGSQSEFVPSMLYTETFGPDQNYSFSAGNVIEETYRVTETTKVLNKINFSINGEVAFEIGAKIQGFGGSYQKNIPITFEVEKKTTNVDSSYMGFGYVLSDNDESDYISLDVKKSNSGWGPIFRKRAGLTMCPHESQEPFLYYVHDSLSAEGNVFSVATQAREVPGIDIEPKTISGVPETQAAVFTLNLTNNSGAMQDMVYTLMVDEASNPYGAVLKIDGQSVHRDIMVPYGETINKTLTVEKGPEELDYTGDDRLGLILRSSCQYSYGTSNVPDIADTIYLAVSFEAGCSEISINKPSDAWILNKSSEDDTTSTSTVNILNIKLDDYDWNYYSLEDVILQYKKSAEPEGAFSMIETFIKVEDGEEIGANDESLPLGSVNLAWDMYSLEDGDYDIRAYTNCSVTSVESEIHSGHKDTRLPEPFGSAQPADGILSPNDEIQMNWSESLDENRFYSQQTNITMSAIKNMSEVSHDAFVYMDSGSSLEIPYGLNIQHSSFTVEMWINPKTTGTIFQQGYDNNRLSLFLNEDKTLGIQYEIAGEIISASSQTALALATEAADAWQHIAFVFDNDLKTISFIINGTLVNSNDSRPFLCDYIGEGPISIGGGTYQGGLHELRVWSTNKYATSIYQTLGIKMSGKEAGIKGYWPMDELFGYPNDLARSRHMSGEVNWAVAKKGFGYDFSSNSILNAPFATKAYEATDDFTMEFWFKSIGVDECMVSSGSYKTDLEVGNLDAWSIGLDNQGRISIDHNLNNGSTLLMNSSEQFNDDVWHHLAIVKNAKSTTTLFVDGIEQASCSSELTKGFGSPQLTLGAKLYSNSASFEYSNYFTGKMDEFRLWHLKRTFSQLNRYRNIRLDGTELGLDTYYPFEQYEIAQGVSLLTASYSDNSDTLNLVLDLTSIESYESFDLPLVRMSNPYLSVFHNALVNQDQTLLSITEDLAAVEGTVVDVTMDNLFDLYGNKANPVTWSFYVNKNQLVWDENLISIEKALGESVVFETNIVNQGGSVESFEITNLPSWLSASPSQGLLDPNSFTAIQFVINETLFIGDYSEQIILTGNNGVSELLKLELNVEAVQPEFAVNYQDYQFDMNFIGKVSVDGIRSRDELDVLVAYVNEEPRGFASPMYIDEYDAYFIFMTVYSNVALGEEISFRLWDASEGKIQSKVKINQEEQILFYDGSIVGDLTNLAAFEADNTLRQEIYLAEGWNWLSLNLDANDEAEIAEILIPTVTQNLNESAINVFKGKYAFTQYAEDYGWVGSMSSIKLGDMYMMKIATADTLMYEGIPVDLSNPVYNIAIEEGWNWIGYLGQRPLGINEALSSVNSTSGDLIKSKSSFSIYASESIGWLGTLDIMKEGEGYMLKTAEDHTLIYPESSLYGSGSYRIDGNQYPEDYWAVDPNKYEGSMTIIAQINHADYLNPNSENILGAFKGMDCVGNISATPIDTERSLYFITVYGEPEDFIQFEFYDEQKSKTYQTENSLVFVNNSSVGSIDEPYIIQIDVEAQDAGVYFDCMVYPNPFKELFVLEYMLDQSQEVEIVIYDVMGRFVKKISKGLLESGLQNHTIDASELNKGYYFIEINFGEMSYRKSIIKS
jgi:hypothetical protein